MLFDKEAWNRYTGKTDWKNGDPEQGLIHTVCGGEIKMFVQNRTIWEKGPGPCASDGQEPVALIQCIRCHGEPTPIKPGTPIQRSATFVPS